ncbi:MAG: PSD1 and planctomycete cytochrome C domain-containing protein [Chthoniobacter sp.]|uniref:PSD1 and planctomycete cytochrome C domain-containing protein n=1 Tax=Chthoniobacter sp. TaxID=2510640 RepID=UPI0032A53642
MTAPFSLRAGLLAAALSVAGLAHGEEAPLPDKVDFNRDVRPILSENCFKCHGFDPKNRKGDRRIDTREGALAEKDGVRAVVPGKVAESDLSLRIHSKDKDEQMPPPKSGKQVTARQIAVLDKWIEQGAPYDLHWAFKKPQQAPLPAVKRADWPRNPIDHFVLAHLESAGLSPSPEADKYTLCRRLYLDLVGLPPTPAEADAFAGDASPDAYEKLVDHLLASPRYGERWARRWLDLARYADTNGYEKDRPRSIWPYRDWVIKALNDGMPFDQFTIEQLAGDLLPNATPAQRIATGFNRNTMLNEEGGIDPLEFRYLAMVDRVSTAGTTWLGITVGCAQCHTHKYDPIPHREYYEVMASLNNADEPEMDLPPPDVAAQEAARNEKLAKLIAALPEKWPVTDRRWTPLHPGRVETASGEQPKILPDHSALFAAPGPEKDDYTFILDAGAGPISQLRLEALTDPSLPKEGPGRVAHGNFVLSEITVTAAPKNAPEQAQVVKLSRAEADVSQPGFEIEKAIDAHVDTGWAVHREGSKLNAPHTATFHFEQPVSFPTGTQLVVRLEQQYGQQHTLGRVRFSVANDAPPRPVAEQRREAIDQGFAKWLERERARSVHWTTLPPVDAKSNLPLLTVGNDGVIFVSGDMSKSDTYELKFRSELRGITAVRLEVLADDRLPKHGPGRIFYEGPAGDFMLSNIELLASGHKQPWARATHSFAKGKFEADKAIDDNLQTGWSIDGGQGRNHEAVFNLAAPLAAAGEFTLKMLFERYFACGLGKFRISVTTDPAAEAREMPVEIASLFSIPDEKLTAEQREKLRAQFLLSAPELATARKEIDQLRKPLQFTTTLVMQERPPENPRPTFVHNRGEFLQPTERVEPGVLSLAGAFPPDAPHNRLGFARWLVSRDNPLTARVIMNRDWAAFFGRGIVRTLGDFGFQGDSPSNPELLDWLAVEFMQRGWSVKQMHKLIVTSATYRQSSRATPELIARDPDNKLLARGPRFRLEAEIVRDSALLASGLLSEKIGGPSVYPPQPDGVMDAAYGSPKWNADDGESRYRRSLYTFMKRTAPFALYANFDAPTGEACLARRDVSNTPLQALALLNDVVFLDASRALGHSLAAQGGSVEDRVRTLFRRCLTRPPTDAELELLVKFFTTQKERFTKGELNAKELAGEGAGDVNECAAWTALARALWNLDEAITRS